MNKLVLILAGVALIGIQAASAVGQTTTSDSRNVKAQGVSVGEGDQIIIRCPRHDRLTIKAVDEQIPFFYSYDGSATEEVPNVEPLPMSGIRAGGNHPGSFIDGDVAWIEGTENAFQCRYVIVGSPCPLYLVGKLSGGLNQDNCKLEQHLPQDPNKEYENSHGLICTKNSGPKAK